MFELNLKDIVINFTEIDPNLLKVLQISSMPAFHEHKADFKLIEQCRKKYDKFKNIVIIGNGGSITSFEAYYKALAENKTKKKVTVVSTMDPDFIAGVMKENPKASTLVIVISKSGNTVGVIEAMMQFIKYKILIITSDNNGVLRQIAEEMQIDWVKHPEIGGRFTGTSEAAYIPLALLGVNVRKIDQAARRVYDICSARKPLIHNPALQLACSLHILEKNGYTEIFAPIYSPQLFGFSNLLVQLMHETVCKNEEGQTVYAALAPESQHHTNQRFFGGRKNVMALFFTVNSFKSKLKTEIPKKLYDITLKDTLLKILNRMPLSKAVEYEYKGTQKDAVQNNIPNATIALSRLEDRDMGELIAFWHYVAVYSALLRNVNPYDQPHVEASKQISFELRKGKK